MTLERLSENGARRGKTAAACPGCRSTDVDTDLGPIFDHITGDPFQIVLCRTCGLRFTWPMPADMERYYPPNYRGYTGLTRRVLQMLYRRRVGAWIRDVPAGHALEIGCGAGLMLEELRRSGWRVTGTERTPEAAAYVREQIGIEVIAGGVEHISGEARFDLIVMFQVLEHISDPRAMLAHCVRLLAPGGRLIIGVPNLDSWQARFSGIEWVHLDPPRHLVHFTPAALGRMLQDVGLEVTATRFSSPEHDPYGWVQSSINKWTGQSNLLTRFLMGLERGSARVAIDVVLAALLAPAAVLLAAVSWAARRGALMEVVALKPSYSR